MSCICNGLPGCPCCGPEPEPEIRECPECCGDGFFYYDSDNDLTDKPSYDNLPDDQRSYVECPRCGGSGEIEL